MELWCLVGSGLEFSLDGLKIVGGNTNWMICSRNRVDSFFSCTS